MGDDPLRLGQAGPLPGVHPAGVGAQFFCHGLDGALHSFSLCASVLQAFRLISWDAVLVLVLALLFAAIGVGGLLFGVALGKKGRTDAQLVQRAQAAAAARR